MVQYAHNMVYLRHPSVDQLRVLVEMQLMALRVLMDLGVAPPPAPTMTSSVEAMYVFPMHTHALHKCTIWDRDCKMDFFLQQVTCVLKCMVN